MRWAGTHAVSPPSGVIPTSTRGSGWVPSEAVPETSTDAPRRIAPSAGASRVTAGGARSAEGTSTSIRAATTARWPDVASMRSLRAPSDTEVRGTGKL